MAHKQKAEAAPEVELPITPMLDMAFQLLAFFILTYHPSALEGQMELNLPAQAEAKAKTPEDVDPSKLSDNDQVDLPSELTVVLKTQTTGNVGTISQITVEGKEGGTPVQVDDNLQALTKFLEKVQKDLTNKDDIKIQADSAIKYAFVMEAMDACTKAGFKRVGFAAPPDLGVAGN
jgi:biopolymer transport protein ExbD